MKGRRLDPNSPLPRYYQIYSALLAMIQTGELAAGAALPPERQVAEAFGVARPTVVKALDLLARDGLIEKQQGRGSFVLEPARDNNASQTIAFISSPSITHELMVGMSQAAFEHHYHLQVLGVDFTFEHLGTYLNACCQNGVEGFLIYGRPDKRDVQAYRTLLDNGVFMVMVDRYYPELSCDVVVYDNNAASYALTRKLLGRGHRIIAIIPGFELETTAVRDRLIGYRRALEEGGVGYDEDLVWPDIYDKRAPSGVLNEAYRADLRARLETYGPTALITINDLVADYVTHDLLVLQSSQMRSVLTKGSEPSQLELDIELATFSDKLKADHSYLGIVAVHPTQQLGRAAAKLLIDRLNGTVTGAPQHQVIPMDIAELHQGVRQFA